MLEEHFTEIKLVGIINIIGITNIFKAYFKMLEMKSIYVFKKTIVEFISL